MHSPIECRDRYARAVQSSSLTPDPESSAAPLDFLGAAGFAARRQPLGMLLQRLRASPTPLAQSVAGAALAERLRDAVRRRQVRRDGADSDAIAADALAWWLDPTCLSCGGVRFVARDSRLTAKHCTACSGSGLRPAGAGEATGWVLDAISRHVGQSEAALRRGLA